jgi:hypothetical protein
MQTTYYSVLLSSGGVWVELAPRPRSRRAALAMGNAAASKGDHVRVERHVRALEIVKTLNRPSVNCAPLVGGGR